MENRRFYMPDPDRKIACQISYLPLGTENIEEKVEKILHIIRNSGLEFKVNSFATEIKGSKAEVFSLIEDIFETAETESQFVLDLKLSNICGC
jgi:uncharacterized protein YqgV (UPF0045/DUF77 family)